MAWVIIGQEPLRKQGRFALIVEADTITEAELIKGILIQYHIDAMVTPISMGYLPAQGAVWVLLDKWEEALKVLEELKKEGAQRFREEAG